MKTSIEYWDYYYRDRGPAVVSKNDATRKLIEQYIPVVLNSDNKTCIEIGCYPGGYLSIFGDMGYTIYGVDFCKQLEILPKYLKIAGYRIGNFWNEDFMELNIESKFDVVSSFGFIEHFTNYMDVIEKHISLVKIGGYLIIEVPNFIGKFQNWFHVTFDYENYTRHHIPAMEIEEWEKILGNNNFTILFKGYWGDFGFWVEDEKRTVFARIFLKTFSVISRVFLSKILPKNKKCYSPFSGVIAVKKND